MICQNTYYRFHFFMTNKIPLPAELAQNASALNPSALEFFVRDQVFGILLFGPFIGFVCLHTLLLKWLSHILKVKNNSWKLPLKVSLIDGGVLLILSIFLFQEVLDNYITAIFTFCVFMAVHSVCVWRWYSLPFLKQIYLYIVPSVLSFIGMILIRVTLSLSIIRYFRELL